MILPHKSDILSLPKTFPTDASCVINNTSDEIVTLVPISIKYDSDVEISEPILHFSPIIQPFF